MQRGMGIADVCEGRRAAACRVLFSQCPERGNSKAGCHQRGLLVELAESCKEVGGPDVTNDEVSGWSTPFAVTAAIAPARPDCVTENTGCTVELAQLGNTFLNELLATMLLNHVQHEAVVRGSFVNFWT